MSPLAPASVGERRRILAHAAHRESVPVGVTQPARSRLTTSENRKLSRKDLGGFMTNLIERSAAAYSSPLLIKHLLNSALLRAPEQEIVYRSQARFSYRDFRDRVGRLASGLAKLGVQSA